MITGEHLGMSLAIDEFDHENRGYFEGLAEGELRLQKCSNDGLFRYPPTSRCPFCGAEECTWEAVEGTGTVHSYTEVHHAIQPAFAKHTPYMVLMVELDTQKGAPTAEDGLRIVGNLAEPDGSMATPETVERCGIGSRVKLVPITVGEKIGMGMWVLADDQPETVWRYPD